MKILPIVFLMLFAFAQASLAQYRFGERDPVYIAGTPPSAYPVHGIDISRYQGYINWHALRSAGIEFAYLKATEGSDWTDPTYYNNVHAAFRAGIRVGAYHFYHFCSSPQAQAAHFNRVVERSDGWLPPVVDLEWVHQSSCQRRPSAHQILREIGQFMFLVEQRYGTKPIIYTNPAFYREGGLASFRGRYEFWLRSTAANPALTYPRQNWAFWQYTGTGALPGISGNVDINVFAGSYQDWQSWVTHRGVRGIKGVY